MNTLLQSPAWPKGLKRQFFPIANLNFRDDPHDWLDRFMLNQARGLARSLASIQCSGMAGTWTECFFSTRGNFNAVNTTATEASLLAGPNVQPIIPATFWNQQNRGAGKVVSLLARGVLGTTSTPTIIFQLRMGTTVGSSSLTGTSCGVSPTITTASGVTNKWWELRLDLQCNTPGSGTGNCTLEGSGYVTSPGGFASPFVYALEPSTPDTATWTLTIDDSLTQYINASVTWGTSNALNTITTKQLYCFGVN